MLLTLLEIVSYLAWIVQVVVISQFVLGLLLTFNVVSLHNQFVGALWHALNAILDPVLRPIRRIMPDTGMIDFSPLVLLILLNILVRILAGVALEIGY